MTSIRWRRIFLVKKKQVSTTHIFVMNSHELHIFYMDLHAESRSYKNAINEINIKRQRKGKTPLERRIVEMNNFQNPQVKIYTK